MVSEKTPMLKFWITKDTWLTKKHVNYLHGIHISIKSRTNDTGHDLLISVATIQCLKYSGQEFKKHNLQKSTLSFWHTCDLETQSRSLNLEWQYRPQARLYSCKSLKDLTLIVSQEVFFKGENMSVTSLGYVQKFFFFNLKMVVLWSTWST